MFLNRLSILLLPDKAQFSIRHWHDRSQVPRIFDDRKKATNKIKDTGYYFRYHREGIEALPRIPDSREPLYKPKSKISEPWRESQARFGENDYIDLLGDGSLHPAQLQYHVPRWLRGFPGQHKAIEPIKLIHYRNLYKSKLEQNSPHKWHQLNKRIKHLLQYHNYHKQDELRAERSLGLWDEQPDFFYKDKSRRSYQDLV
ncbi:39S ribosomal protein L51, mitochondrial [Globodera pallida]|nr:39S ribosomal protein L51, mitochondrial [Globodera pallida]